MPKRRRFLGDDNSDDGKRRRKMDVSEICQELLDTIRGHKSEEGRVICEAFIRAPKRRSLADYYEVVSTPMDLCRVQQKIKMEEYEEVEQMSADIELLINNAKAYYKKESQEYQDACDLWNLYNESKNDILGGADDTSSIVGGGDDTLSNPGSEGTFDDDVFEELFSTVMTASDEGRSLSSMFQLLPPKSKYPDYYRIISEPIDLKAIATKIQNNVYQCLSDLERDLLLMVKNAKAYNEPGSQIYRDANTLRKIISNKKTEIDQRKYIPVKTSERIRAKKLLPSGQKWSTITAALKSENDSEVDPLANVSLVNINEDTMNEEMNESDPEDADTNPQWQLYEAVKNYTTNQGVSLADPFNRLPSKRFYPDYYMEIKHPMSLAKIKAKIKNGAYKNSVDVVDDMNLMFDNAKRYNRPDSKIFKDAVRLQKVMHVKAKELFNYVSKETDSSESDNDDNIANIAKKAATPKPKKSMSSAMTHELKKARRSQQDVDAHLKKRMKLIFKSLVDYVDDIGRPLITLFLEKPSIKDYPDYYHIIEKPIDMRTIEGNIKFDRYSSVDTLVADFLLMFKNCKQYNEEGSQIYRDAETLELVLKRKLEELGPYVPTKPKRTKTKMNSSLQQKLKTLYDTVINYTDNKGNKLSHIFMKLPSRIDYPDYYEVTKKPIDLEKIGSKVRTGIYESPDDLLADLVLMFDNACKYNEPDSQIYKSALSLQHVALQTKLELTDTRGVPDVKAIVQDILTNLFISIYNHQDEEGRCYSDSLNEVFEDIKPGDSESVSLNLDTIKRNLDKGRYRRLDRFQQDMFEVFETARKFSRTDSQAFEDSIELQTYFIRLRNDLCKNGENFISSALNYTEADLNAAVEVIKSEKFPLEQQEIDLDLDPKQREKEFEGSTSLSGPAESIDEVSLNNVVYRPLDFVLIEPREKSMEPHIIHIQKLWRDSSGEIWIYGCWFYRPNETFHIASKKFLEKEVFKSDNYNNTPLGQVVGKCIVMFVKDYFKCKPVGFDDNSVFVCESRYCTRIKAFKKIKVWPYNQNVELIQREYPIPMIRVPSVFKDKTEKPREEVEEEDETNLPKVLDMERYNIICDAPENVTLDDGSVYYEQFTIPSGSFKTGDCCYVRTDQGRNLICRIDRIWVDKEGNAFFHGPWFVQPMELPPLTPRMFYPQEVFLSSIEDTNPLLSICDRCAVLDMRDYITRRPTELAEQDIYVCESKYLEHEKKFIKLQKEISRVTHINSGVVEDEFFIFRKPLSIARSEYGADKSVVVARKGQSEIPSPLNIPLASSETENDESNDVVPIVVNEQPVVVAPVASVKKKLTKRLVTGYIIFASEVRKSVVQANPECNFGDISRIIGTEWKNLPSDTKTEYEKKAQKQNEESAREAAREAERLENYPQSPASAHSLADNGVYECHWGNKCDFQCEDSQDLYEHLISEPMGHIWQSYGEVKDKEEPIFQCLFHGCGRVKKGAQPFPSIQRLIRHCKEVHVTKQNPKLIAPENRSKNFTPSRKSVMSPATPATLSTAAAPVVQTAAPQTTSMYGQAYKHAAFSGVLSQSRSTPPPPVLSVAEPCSSGISALHSALAQPTGNSTSSQSATGNMPVLSPFWASGTGTGVQVKPLEPIFVTLPAKQKRLVHTNIYLRYMERLRSDCKHISNWEAQLNATPENTVTPDRSQLPTHWLSNGAGNHGNVVNALWALRNFMFQDALKITKPF